MDHIHVLNQHLYTDVVKRFMSTIGFVLAMMPSVSHAETTVTWDFRKPEAVMPLVDGLTTVEKTVDGLHIKTLQDGLIGWQNPPIPKTDAVYVYVKNALPAEAAFMWQPKGGAPGDLLQLFFTSPKTDTFERIVITPADYEQWTEKTPVVAFGFPAGTDMVIQKVEWKSWNAAEKIMTAAKSMWRFDTLSQYGINFLWGPLFTTNQATLDTIYDGLPPKGVSGMRVVYAIIAIALIVAGIFFLLEKKRRAVLTVIATVSALWLLLDIRMGAELLSYAFTDIRSADFRTLLDVPRMTEEAEQILLQKNANSIVLLEPEGNAYVAHVRLKLYPLDVSHYSESLKKESKRAWYVVHRPDIKVANDMLTTEAGRALSAPGKILKQFNADSFLFLEQ